MADEGTMNGLSTKRPRTDDAALQDKLMGKKAAQAHRASKKRPKSDSKQSGGVSAHQTVNGPPEVESDDEGDEDSRVSMLKSKTSKRKAGRP